MRERLLEFKGVVEKALSEQSYLFEVVRRKNFNLFSVPSIHIPAPVIHSKELLQGAKEDLLELQTAFLEERSRVPFPQIFTRNKISYIEGLFELDTLAREVKKTNSVKGEYYEREYYRFEDAINDLHKGRIERFGVPVIGLYYAYCLLHEWLLERMNISNKEEPDFFRKVWLEPDQDIPFLLDALYRLEFIDESQKWRVGDWPNPLGVIVAMQRVKNRDFFVNLPRTEIEKAFCERFGINRPKKGFEAKNKPFENGKDKMAKFLSSN